MTIALLRIIVITACTSATFPRKEQDIALPESHRTLLWPTLLETVNLSEVIGSKFAPAIAEASEETYRIFLEERRHRLEGEKTTENNTVNSGIVNDDFYHWQMALPVDKRPLEKTPEFAQLVATIDRLVKRYLEHAGGNREEISRKRLSMSYWTAVHFANEYHSPHTHTGQDCVAVFYAKVAEGPGNGKLVLMDPRGQVPPFGRTVSIDVYPGQLVIFPSWLNHMVSPTTGSSDAGSQRRVMIAFNVQDSRYPGDIPSTLWHKDVPSSLQVPWMVEEGSSRRCKSWCCPWKCLRERATGHTPSDEL
ncbi:hypothetical protein FOL47_001061 [Perkinsus chesapeaki]|uniref:Fe2OG dioxygenase domain-containing protein n=1 Tax=Perkinsus chesapeaki TaxID=330153 RepID=A0A7J6MKG6_PERCH|nr:hypothetical protein FOL47_001061 [Perkinsus chesapeaki]